MDSPFARIAVVLAALGALAGGAFWYTTTRPGKPCPELTAVHIVSSSRAAGGATDEWKNVPYGESVVLAAVVEARRPDGEIFYISPVERPVVGGKTLFNTRPAWPAGCGELVFLWFSVENAVPGDAASPWRDRFQGGWGFAPTQPADVRPRLLTREGAATAPNVGAAFFRVRAELRHPSTGKLLAHLSTPGADHLNAGGDPRRVHRVAIGQP